MVHVLGLACSTGRPSSLHSLAAASTASMFGSVSEGLDDPLPLKRKRRTRHFSPGLTVSSQTV